MLDGETWVPFEPKGYKALVAFDAEQESNDKPITQLYRKREG